jgi:hypothetical protein
MADRGAEVPDQVSLEDATGRAALGIISTRLPLEEAEERHYRSLVVVAEQIVNGQVDRALLNSRGVSSDDLATVDHFVGRIQEQRNRS